jgi:hypothetical protein
LFAAMGSALRTSGCVDLVRSEKAAIDGVWSAENCVDESAQAASMPEAVARLLSPL